MGLSILKYEKQKKKKDSNINFIEWYLQQFPKSQKTC